MCSVSGINESLVNDRSPVKHALFITSFRHGRMRLAMCGRYSIAIEPRALEERFGAVLTERAAPRYNAAPSQALPVILGSDPRRIVLVRWGIAPAWLAKAKGGHEDRKSTRLNSSHVSESRMPS